MRCPKCKSTNIAKGLKSVIKGSFAICYDCGFTANLVEFAENGDVLPADELTYAEVLNARNDVHPLLNASSTHYNMFDGLEAIEVLEAVMTTDELKAWCRGNIYKYRLRLGNKDDVSGEVKKIRTYEAYYKYLENKND